MKKKISYKEIIIALSLLFVIYAGGRLLFFRIAENILKTKIAEQKKNGIFISYAGLKVGPWKNRIEINKFRIEVKNKKNNQVEITAFAEELDIENVSLIQAVFKKNLVIDYINIKKSRISNIEQKKNSEEQESNSKEIFKNIKVKHLHIEDLAWISKDSVHKNKMISRIENLELKGISLNNLNKRKIIDLQHSSIQNIHLTVEDYDLKCKQFEFNKIDKNLKIDSIKIIPLLSREKYAVKWKKEKDYFEGGINTLKMNDFEFNFEEEFSFHSTTTEINFKLEVFRDKRQPFIKSKREKLPIEMISEFGFSFGIDTIKIIDSYASYEEFPGESDFTGKVFFEKMNIDIYRLAHPQMSESPYMKAQAMFMGNGLLKVDFSFPQKPDGMYYANGTLTEMDMKSINPMMKASAKTEIERGTLQELKFKFGYNDIQSKGDLHIRTKDLKLIALKKDDQKKKAGFKTLVVNLIAGDKKEKEETMGDMKSGKIEFTRIQKRAIFNYWWNSILSGVKSAYLPDQLQKQKKK